MGCAWTARRSVSGPTSESPMKRTFPALTSSAHAPPANGPPDELLVGVRPVHVGGVEERDAEIERAVDRRNRLGLVGRAVELAHAHAAEPDRGDFEAGEASRVHGHGSIHQRPTWTWTASNGITPATIT